MRPDKHTCKNCGNHFTGKFCNLCGEKVYDDHDKKIFHLLEEVFHFVWHFEGTFLVTIKTFLTKPGKFSLDYCAGIRRKYFKPISLFLTIVVIYLLFPRFHGLNMRFYSYVSKESKYSWYAVPIAKKKVNTLHLTTDQLADLYDKKSSGFSKLFLLMLIPLCALAFWLLFINAHRFFFDHFILATEICSFYILTNFLILPFLSFLIEKINPSWNPAFDDGSWITFVMLGILAFFIIVAFRRFYKQKQWVVAVKGLAFLFIFIFAIRFIYNMLLYYLVMLFM